MKPTLLFLQQIQQEEEEIKGKNNNSQSPSLQMDCEQKEEQSGAISPANLSTLVADNQQQDQEECCSNVSDSSPISPEIVSLWLKATLSKLKWYIDALCINLSY